MKCQPLAWLCGSDAVHVYLPTPHSCARACVCYFVSRAASQLGDNFSPIYGPGLPAGSTVSSYIEQVGVCMNVLWSV